MGSGGTAALLRSGAGAAAASSLFWGPELTATADVYTRIRLDLYWPDVRTATITRVDADGTSSPVRNAEPLFLPTSTVVYDHEAPLDQTCYYQVTSTEAAGVVGVSDPVAVSSGGRSWLKHVYRPALNRAVHLHAMPARTPGARRGVARPIDRPDPIVVHQIRSTDSGSVVIQTDGLWSENVAIRDLLADGAPLLLQQTAVLGEGNLYISVDAVGLALLDEQAGWLHRRNWTLPFDVIARPSGTAAGPYGISHDDVAAAFMTHEHVAAAVPTYTDLAAGHGL